MVFCGAKIHKYSDFGFRAENFGVACHSVLAAGGHIAAQPACAPAGNALEEDIGLALQAETAAGGQLVEGGVLVGGVAGFMLPQAFLDLPHKAAVERYALHQAGKKRLHVGREEGGMGGDEAAVLLLPFMTVGRSCRVVEMGLEVGGLVQEDPQEEIRPEVAVDADFVEFVFWPGPSVVTQLAASLQGDVEMYAVEVEVVVDYIHRPGRQVVAEYGAVSFGSGQNVGQSQSDLEWRYM